MKGALICDDPSFIPKHVPTATAYDRRRRKNAPGKALSCIGGVLFVLLGVLCLLPVQRDALALIASALCFFVGGMGIRLRQYPHFAGLFALLGAFVCCVSCALWLSRGGCWPLVAACVVAALEYGAAWLVSRA